MASQEIATQGLTDLQSGFIAHLVSGLLPGKAALAAGYPESSAGVAASRLLRNPKVLQTLHIELSRALQCDATMARAVIARMANDETMHPKIRLDAAKTLLDRAGHIAPRAAASKDASEISMHEMSTDELRSLANKLEDEIAGRAKDVSSAIEAPSETQAIDIIG